MGIEEKIGRLEAVEAIKQLMCQYALVCDSGYDVDQMMNLLSPDFVMDFGEAVGYFEGEEVRRFWESAPSINLKPMHYMISPVISLAPDGLSATGQISLWEATTQLDDEKHEIPVWGAGVYRNEFKKVGNSWKISRIYLPFEVLCDADKGWLEEKVRIVM